MARLRVVAGLFSLLTMFLFLCSGCEVEYDRRERLDRDRYWREHGEERRDWDRDRDEWREPDRR